MNTIEEIKKVMNWINDAMERCSGKSNDYKSGAYEATLNIALRDLDTICKLLELREQHNIKFKKADPDPCGVLDLLDEATKIR